MNSGTTGGPESLPMSIRPVFTIQVGKMFMSAMNSPLPVAVMVIWRRSLAREEATRSR